jgi:hypothetical protein
MRIFSGKFPESVLPVSTLFLFYRKIDKKASKILKEVKKWQCMTDIANG